VRQSERGPLRTGIGQCQDGLIHYQPPPPNLLLHFTIPPDGICCDRSLLGYWEPVDSGGLHVLESRWMGMACGTWHRLTIRCTQDNRLGVNYILAWKDPASKSRDVAI
jgi:hypothetical protein